MELIFGNVLLLAALAVIAIAVVGYILTYLAFLKKAGPNEVIVVSGRGRVKFITGGADMVIPLFHTWNSLSLEVMTLDVTTPEVYTSQGVPIMVDGVAQIKIKKDEASLHAAAERFLGKPPQEIAKIALETVQGHLRAILGTLSVEDIYKNRDQFAQKVQEISAGDLAQHGPRHRLFHHPRHPRQARLPRGSGKGGYRGGEAHRRHRRSRRDQGVDGRPGRRGARDSRAAGRSIEARPGGRSQARRRGRGGASRQEPAPGGGAGGRRTARPRSRTPRRRRPSPSSSARPT